MASPASPTGLFEKPTPYPRSRPVPATPAVTGPPPPFSGLGFASVPRGPRRWRAVEAAAIVAIGVVVLLRVVRSAMTLPAGAGETRLLAAAGPSLTESFARAQLDGYVQLTAALGRHADLLGAVRETAVVASAVALAALVMLGLRLRPSPVAVALGFGLLACFEPALAVFATAGPGLVGVMWLAAGAVALTWDHRVPRALGVLAAATAVLTAPLLAVPVAVAVAVATTRRWVPTAEVALALGAAAPVLVLLTGPPSAGAVGQRGALLGVAAAVVAAGLAGAVACRALRLPAAVAAAVLVVVTVPWSPSGALAPALAVSVAVLGVAGLDVLAGLAAASLDRPGRAGLVPVVALAACAAAVVALLPGLRGSPSGSGEDDTPSRALASWITAATDPSTTVTVPDDVRPDLVRDGVAATRLVPGGAIVVRSGAVGTEDVLARFGTGDAALTAVAAGSTAATGSERRARADVGAQLADNPALSVPPDAVGLLRSGDVDSRVLVVLAGLCGRGPVTVTDVPAVDGDDAGLPRHRIILAGADPATLMYLAAQQSPFRPAVMTTPAGVVLTWPVPGPPALLGRG